MSSFIVRRVSQQANFPQQSSAPKKLEQKLLINPPKLTFDSKQHLIKQNVIKFTLTNYFNYKIQFQIKQPHHSKFLVKCTKNQLLSAQSIEFYLFNNFEYFTKNLTDQIIISTHHTQISIPIQVINYEQTRKCARSLRKQSKYKQNIQNPKLKTNSIYNNPNHPIKNYRQIRRKDGLMILNRDRDRYQVNLMSIKHQPLDISLSSRRQKFSQQYERIQLFLKDKAIKNQIYLGQKQPQPPQINQIISFNLSLQLLTHQLLQHSIQNRHQTLKTQNGPSLRIFHHNKLQWNKNKNQPYLTFLKAFNKLSNQIRNIVIHFRFRKFHKIFQFYRNFKDNQDKGQPLTKIINNQQLQQQQQNYPNLNEQQSILLKDTTQDLQSSSTLHQQKRTTYYCRKISKLLTTKKSRTLGQDFTKYTLTPKTLPLAYSQQKKKKLHTFQVKPRIGFDIWVFLQQTTMYSHQLMNYTKMERLPQWECHPSYPDQQIPKTNLPHNSITTLTNQQLQNKQHSQIQSIQLSITTLPKLSKIQQFIPPQTLHSTSSQYKQSTLKYQFNLYQNYLQPQSQLSSLYSQSQPNIENDIHKPSKLAILNLSQIKHNRQQYLPYFQTPFPSYILSPLQQNQSQQQLIYQITKNQAIDFSDPTPLLLNKLSSIQSLYQTSQKAVHHKSTPIPPHLLANNISERMIPPQHDVSLNKTNTIFSKQHGLNDNKNIYQDHDQRIYQQIIQYSKLCLLKKYGLAHGKIASFNYFTKLNFNKIYF